LQKLNILIAALV